jgi:hypothetical protein
MRQPIIRMPTRLRDAVLLASSLLTVFTIWGLGPIPQWQAYHAYADARALLGLPNALNVLSNGAFLLVGILGLSDLRRGTRPGSQPGALPELRACHLLYFGALVAVGLGSIYYHLQPDDSRLLWDRLPMTVGFISLTCIVIGEQVGHRAALRLLWPGIALGLASVFYWAWTESSGAGDLRPYIAVQLLPMIWIPLLLLLFPTPFDSRRQFGGLIGLYLLAKAAELEDVAIYDLIGVSGHSLKHLLAAMAAAMVVLAFRQRRYRP